MHLRAGDRFTASWYWGPFTATHVSGPCTCRSYTETLFGSNTPAAPHYHVSVTIDGKEGTFFLADIAAADIGDDLRLGIVSRPGDFIELLPDGAPSPADALAQLSMFPV
jgi:hypothetical protein